MNKIMVMSAAMAVMLTACTGKRNLTNNGDVSNMGLVASLLKNACHDYLDNEDTWQLAKQLLTQQAVPIDDIERDVCQCASTEAAHNLNTEQKLSLISSEARKKVLLDVVAPVTLACYQQFEQQF